METASLNKSDAPPAISFPEKNIRTGGAGVLPRPPYVLGSHGEFAPPPRQPAHQACGPSWRAGNKQRISPPDINDSVELKASDAPRRQALNVAAYREHSVM